MSVPLFLRSTTYGPRSCWRATGGLLRRSQRLPLRRMEPFPYRVPIYSRWIYLISIFRGDPELPPVVRFPRSPCDSEKRCPHPPQIRVLACYALFLLRPKLNPRPACAFLQLVTNPPVATSSWSKRRFVRLPPLVRPFVPSGPLRFALPPYVVPHEL